MSQHRRAHLRERGLEAARLRARDGEVQEAARQRGERHAVVRRTAAVDASSKVRRIDLASLRDRVAYGALHVPVGIEVLSVGGAELARHGEKTGVLAGAVVAQRVAILSAFRVAIRKTEPQRPVRTAEQRFGFRAALVEQTTNDRDMSVSAGVGAGGDRELLGRKPETNGRTRKQQGQGLKRFDRRARRHAKVRVTETKCELPAASHDGDGRRVPRFHTASARHHGGQRRSARHDVEHHEDG